jgi:hypothetical protein
MIICPKCGNKEKFAEIHIGGYRKHEWTQENNGRFIFDGSNYDKVHDSVFECGKCHCDLSNLYRKFLQALFKPFDGE